jgi:hypothetical protein
MGYSLNLAGGDFGTVSFLLMIEQYFFHKTALVTPFRE